MYKLIKMEKDLVGLKFPRAEIEDGSEKSSTRSSSKLARAAVDFEARYSLVYAASGDGGVEEDLQFANATAYNVRMDLIAFLCRDHDCCLSRESCCIYIAFESTERVCRYVHQGTGMCNSIIEFPVPGRTDIDSDHS